MWRELSAVECPEPVPPARVSGQDEAAIWNSWQLPAFSRYRCSSRTASQDCQSVNS